MLFHDLFVSADILLNTGFTWGENIVFFKKLRVMQSEH